MALPNFFCDIDTLNYLLGMEFTGEYKDIDLSLDIIQLPYTFLFTSDEANYTMKGMLRGEIYTHGADGFETVSAVINKVSGEGEASANSALGESVVPILYACRAIGRFIQDKGLAPLYAGLDPDEAGILLSMEGDEVTYRVVSGKERPDMVCSDLFGSEVVCRPYMDEDEDDFFLDEMSLEELLEAAEDDNESAMRTIAMAYYQGDDDLNIEIDPEKAFYWFEKLAQEEYDYASFNVGLFYAKGFGVQRDFAKAAEWMDKAALYGDTDAPEAANSYRQAVADLQLAENGDAAAKGRLGGLYMFLGSSANGFNADADYAEAIKWAKAAADNGDGEGFFVLALAYEKARGVAQDVHLALDYYRQGAEHGSASCMQSLGCYYTRGEIVEESMSMSFALFLRAALLGNGLAMRDVGRCYQFGDGCMGSMRKAVAWYKKALEVIDDDELAQKTALFEHMPILDEEDEYYGEESEGVLSADAQAFIDKIDAGLDADIKRLLLNPDAAIAL